jgi:PAS domain-containing protein
MAAVAAFLLTVGIVTAVRFSDNQDRLISAYQRNEQVQHAAGEEFAQALQDLQRSYTDLLAISGLVLASGGLLIVALVRQLRRSSRLYGEARAAEAAASAARAELVSIIESVPGGFVHLDAQDRVVLANSRYGEIYPALAGAVVPGASFVGLVRTGIDRGQYRIDAEESGGKGEVEAWIGRRMERLRAASGPWEEVLADGRVLLVDERRTADGGTDGVCTDITAQKRAEHTLRQRLTALEASVDGVAILDQAGTFTYLNDSHARMHGYGSADELLGRS